MKVHFITSFYYTFEIHCLIKKYICLNICGLLFQSTTRQRHLWEGHCLFSKQNILRGQLLLFQGKQNVSKWEIIRLLENKIKKFYNE